MKRFYFISSKETPKCSPDILSFEASGPRHRLFLSLKGASSFYVPGEYSVLSTQHSLSLPSGSFPSLPEAIKSEPGPSPPSCVGVCLCLHLSCDSPNALGRAFASYPPCPAPHPAGALGMPVPAFSVPWPIISVLCVPLIAGLCSKYSAYYTLLQLLSRFSRVRLCATPRTAVHQVPLSLGFSRQEYWSGLPFPRYL